MKIRCLTSCRAGFSLIECLVYLVLFVFVAGMAFGAYYTMSQQTRGLNSNVSDISRAMKAGERWRADIRLTRGTPILENENTLLLHQKADAVRYTFRDGAIWRQANDKPPTLFIDGVRASSMQLDRRATVTASRWELELNTRRVEASVRPLFTFIAVPQTEVTP
ncbi:MAG TPA: prepilin-type N-terminal cleavage/methylation domain-containing protein [Candidatus Acidoferrum sp.]|nr:prepilin-type N-terminal cleavage/methylation domain-containing protein [Candidatus Acidoferrum sp.]